MYMSDLRHIHDPVLSSLKMEGIRLLFLYVIRDDVSNKNNSIANCIFYLTKKNNQPEDGS
jgi:hypothetical protein